MPRPSKKFIVPLVGQQGEAIPVVDAGVLLPGDEVEWVSGTLDVTVSFGRADIFGQPDLKMPPGVPSKKLTVQPGAPQTTQHSYTILDNVTQQEFRRQGQPAAHPVMIFGP
jgi:hypothetical protein